MKKVPCVEFYLTSVPTERRNIRDEAYEFCEAYGWRLRAKNGRVILTPHETFISHRNAVASFKRICKALDARGPWEIKDLEGVSGSHAMLVK